MLVRTSPAKNYPCFCGSGKKYKHCCRPKGPNVFDVPPFGKVERLGELLIDDDLYPVFWFQDTGSKEDDYMLVDRRLQDSGLWQWLRNPTVGDGPDYEGINSFSKKEGTPSISMSQAFEMNMDFASATFIQVKVAAKGLRLRRPLFFEGLPDG